MNCSLLSPLQCTATVLVISLMAFQACKAEPDPPPPQANRPQVVTKQSQPLPPCTAAQDPLLNEPFLDNFDRSEIGSLYYNTSGSSGYVIQNGRLCTNRPYNHPLWLKRKLPTNAKITFEAYALSPDIDMKVEAFGDGCSFAKSNQYLATSYVAVLGAHRNTEHWLARMNEHGSDLKRTVLAVGTNLATSKLSANTPYRVELSRTEGRTVRFLVNDVEIHSFYDQQPLQGAGHDHFAFNGWEAPVCFDKLEITPLP